MVTWMVDKNLNEIIRLNEGGYSLKEIAEHYGTYYQNIQDFLRVRGVRLKQWPRNRMISHDFFDEIDNEIKAYLLGFFMADGCVYDSNRFGLCLSQQDESVINLYTEYIYPQANKKVIHTTKGAINRQPQVILRISSPSIVSALSKYGVGPRKTYSDMRVPELGDLTRHLVRGIFDGDGCICVRSNKCGALSIVNGSSILLESIQSILPVSSTIKARRENCYVLNVYRRDSLIKLYHYMYEGAEFYLERKKSKFDLIVGNTEITTGSKELVAS